MNTNKPLTVGRILGKSQVSRLLTGASALQRLDATVRDLLPSPLREHCHVLSTRGETLVLAADSPVWAARLRFHAPGLVKQLARGKTANLRTVRVRIRPADTPPPVAARPGGPVLSEENSAALEQAARSVTDPGLQAALTRLAARKRKPGA